MPVGAIPSVTLVHTLCGHTKSINTLRISPDGTTLLSGADDGKVIVWDMHTGEKIQTISCLFNGPVSATAWTETGQDNEMAFIFGCADGSLHVYRQTNEEKSYEFAFVASAHNRAVEDIAFDHHHRRVASVGDGHLVVWNMNKDYALEKVTPDTKARPYIARSVAFFDRGESVMVFYLESHEVVGYKIDPWAMKWSYQLRARTGHAILSDDARMIFTTNLVDGIDAYTIPPSQPVRSIRHLIKNNVPLQVNSALQGAWIITGSDEGAVRIYDQRTGQLLDCLPHGDVDTLVQIVTSHSEQSTCTIVSGSSSGSTDNIKIWMHHPLQRADAKPVQTVPTPSPSRVTSKQIAVLLAISLLVQLSIMFLPAIINQIPHAYPKF